VNVTGATIDHNSANNDTSISYSLWTSSQNSVTGNTGDYPFTANLVLANGSSNNTVDGNSFGTADFVGVLVADPLQFPQPFGSSSNNMITHNAVHTSGPTGHEIHSSFSTPPPTTRSLPISFGRTPATTSNGRRRRSTRPLSSALSPTRHRGLQRLPGDAAAQIHFELRNPRLVPWKDILFANPRRDSQIR
jgi:hypothetical protein